MVKGICCVCGINIGGFTDPKAWECDGCKRIYCKKCAPKRKGLLKNIPVCLKCGRVLH